MSEQLREALEAAARAEPGSGLVIENFVNGAFVSTEQHIESFNPSTGQVWAKVPRSTAADVDAAVQSAQDAFATWGKTSPEYRSSVLMAIADEVEKNLDLFAVVESKDQGKPVSLAKAVDIPRCVHNFRFFASAVLHQTNELIVVDGSGCTVVAKPSEFTSVTAWLLSKVFVKAGLPPGVVNFVFGTGPEAGQALVSHPLVPAISFTGSTATGRRIQSLCAPLTKRVSLEMGGKNPCIVFADADLSDAIPTVVRSCFANQGEICLCTSRLFVHASIFDEFVQKMVAAAKDIKVGDPSEAATHMGALVSAEHCHKVKSFIKLAVDEGAKFECGQEDLQLPDKLRDGYFVRPVILTGVSESSRLMTEEIFGPVVCVQSFTDTDDVIARANAVEYGLSASVWSTNLDVVHRVAHELQVGTVWCNCWLVRDLHMPFGGMKASGVGREDYRESLEFYSEKKTVCIKMKS